MWDRVSVLVPPASPVDTLMPLADLRSHLGIDHTESDGDLTRFLRTAVAMIDGPRGIGWALLTQTWRLTLDGFPPCVRLPGAPVKSIVAVRWVGADGIEAELTPADYRLDGGSTPARLVPAYGSTWPATRAEIGCVTIDYVLGEATGATVDPRLLDFVCLVVAERDRFREAVAKNDLAGLPFGVQAILDDFRQHAVGG